MERRPQLIVVSDEDYVYGLKHGYYPEMQRQVEMGNVLVKQYSDNLSEYHFDAQPICDGCDMYTLNKYSDRYLRMADANLLNTFINDQIFALKETLVRLGAKEIKYSDETKESDKRTVNVKNDLDVKAVSVNGEFKGEWNYNVDIKASVEYKDYDNKASSVEQIEQFMQKHGMIGDVKLEMLLDRLRERGSLGGKETYEVDFLSEIDSAIQISLQTKVKLLNDNFNFDSSHNHTYRMHKKLEVMF